MAFSDNIPPKKDRLGEHGQHAFTLPAYQKSEFEAAFDEIRQETGLAWDLHVDLSITPIGSRGNVDNAESFLVKATFTPLAIREKRAAVLDLFDVMDRFDTRQRGLNE